MKKEEMLEKIEKVIKDYGCQVEAVTDYPCNDNISIGIEQGNNEGYYVKVCNGRGTEYALRIHDKNEALKTMGSMLTLL